MCRQTSRARHGYHVRTGVDACGQDVTETRPSGALHQCPVSGEPCRDLHRDTVASIRGEDMQTLDAAYAVVIPRDMNDNA